MPNFEIKKVFISDSNAAKEIQILNDIGKDGFEPYAIVGSFHYFKRIEYDYELLTVTTLPPPPPPPAQKKHKK